MWFEIMCFTLFFLGIFKGFIAHMSILSMSGNFKVKIHAHGNFKGFTCSTRLRLVGRAGVRTGRCALMPRRCFRVPPLSGPPPTAIRIPSPLMEIVMPNCSVQPAESAELHNGLHCSSLRRATSAQPRGRLRGQGVPPEMAFPLPLGQEAWSGRPPGGVKRNTVAP